MKEKRHGGPLYDRVTAAAEIRRRFNETRCVCLCECRSLIDVGDGERDS